MALKSNKLEATTQAQIASVILKETTVVSAERIPKITLADGSGIVSATTRHVLFGDLTRASNDSSDIYTEIEKSAGGSATAFCGYESVSFAITRPSHKPTMKAVFKLFDISPQRFWCGLATNTLANSDDQTGESAMIRFSTLAGDTTFKAIVDTGTQTIVDTGITVNSLTKYVIQIEVGTSSVIFDINGTRTTVNAVPTSSTDLGMILETVRNTTNTKRSIYFSSMHLLK